MRSRELLSAVKAHILEHVQKYSDMNLKVYIHNLPVQEVSQQEEVFPFVIIRFDEKKLDEEYTEDTLVLALGVNENQNQEEAGLLLADLHDALTRIFYTQRIVGGYFETQLPIQAKQVKPEKKWNEYHFSSMEITFSYNSLPPRPLGREFDHENEVIYEPSV